MPKGTGRQRKRVRKRDWDADRDAADVSREPWRMRGRETGVAEPIERLPEDEQIFQDIQANGVVVSPYGVQAFVRFDGVETCCRVADDLTDGKRSILAAGDEVRVEPVPAGQPRVTGVRPRRTKLSRPAVHGKREKVFAANIDQLLVVASCAQPVFRPVLIDRYLIAAQLGGVETVLNLNKMDLAEAEPPKLDDYRRLGVPVVCTSCETGTGIEHLRRTLEGKTSVVSGQSGVGKSSLLNALAPELSLATQEVSAATDKGRHTTTSSRLYDLPGGIRIIDTPGVRELGLWGVAPDDLDVYFPDIAAFAPQCKFRDCTHTHEPQCAVREALKAGSISQLRFVSYLRIRASLEEERPTY